MNDLGIFILYLKKILLPLKIISAKPMLGIKVAIPAIAAPVIAAYNLPYFSLFQWSLIVLGILFTIDFVTGVWASYVEYKKAKGLTPANGEYLITTQKLRLCIVKFISYSLAIALAWVVGFLFTIQEFSLHSAMRKFTLPTIVTISCSIIEVYSIFFENFKRMGYDLIAKIRNIIETIYTIYKIIKNKNESKKD